MHIDAIVSTFDRGFHDCSDLHLKDFRIRDAEAATTVTQHWVRFVQSRNALLDLGDIDAK